MPETATATLLFCDIVGSTALFSRLGDDAADGLRRSIFAELRAAVRDFGGTEVKHLGDGLMVVFTASAADAIGSAIAMQRAMGELDSPDPVGGPGPVELRVGISTGEVVSEEGDWFGTPVVEAARLCAAAQPQVILVTDVVRSVAGTRGAYRFEAVGSLELKGLPAAVACSAVEWRAEGESRPDAPLVVSAVLPRPPARRRWLVAGVAAAVLLALVAALVVGTRRSNPAAQPAVAKPAGYVPHLVSRTCDPAVTRAEPRTRCTYLVVPEDRSKPNGRQVQLAVSQAPAVSSGASGVPTISLGLTAPIDDLLNSPVRQIGAHMTMSERGETGSRPLLSCPALNRESADELKWAPTDPQRRAVRARALRGCHDQLVAEGIDLDAYGSRDVALDVRDLAYALKLPKINVQAGLDDTQMAREIAVEAPTLVRAFVLEDVWPPGTDFADGVVGTARGAYEQYLAECRAQAGCATAFPKLDEALPRLYAKYTAHPVTVVVPNPVRSGASLSVLVDGDRVAHTMADALADPMALPLLASTEETGSAEVIAQYAAYHASWPDSFPFAAQFDRYCIDQAPHASQLLRQASVDATPMFRSVALDAGSDGCASWKLAGSSHPPIGADPPAMRAVPTLILSPDLSPSSSTQWADDTARSFGQATIVPLPHLTERSILDGPPCLGRLRVQFLEHPTAALDPRACIASIPRIPFSGT